MGPDAPVPDGHLERNPMRNWLRAMSLSQADAVNHKTVTGENALFLVQEALAVRWVVGHEEEDGDSGHDRGDTFDDL